MGFGFNLFFLCLIFILIPLTGILLVSWLYTSKPVYGKILGAVWFGIIFLVFIASIANWLFSKTELDRNDYTGTYIIHRDYFEGHQADWQYNHFRFQITNQDSIFFYITEKDRILKTYKGTVTTSNPEHHRSDRLIINMEQPTHHILASNPTTYRSNWSFYLVFNSQEYYNLFFKKGEWKPIDQ